MYQLVLYLCWHNDTPNKAAASSSTSLPAMALVICPPEPALSYLRIETRTYIADLSECIESGYARLKVLNTRPGWSRFSLTYECEPVR